MQKRVLFMISLLVIIIFVAIILALNFLIKRYELDAINSQPQPEIQIQQEEVTADEKETALIEEEIEKEPPLPTGEPLIN